MKETQNAPIRLGVLSDIHVDINYDEIDCFETAMVDAIRSSNLDLFLIPGDISNQYETTLKTIDNLQQSTGIRCLFVPGNHDLWNKDYPDKIHTIRIYNELAEHPSCLVGKPYDITQQYTLIGDIGWYDYSFGNTKYTRDEYLLGFHNTRQWKDKQYVHWHVSDEEKTLEQLNKLKDQIQSNKDKKLIITTHMVTHKRFIVPETRPDWDYFNGFLGTDKLKPMLTDNVSHIIFGHVHYRGSITENGKEFITSCLGYRSEWRKATAKEEILDALHVIEL